jgi:hypothetical protein
MAYEWMEPVDTWQEHCDYEANAMFDCRSEAQMVDQNDEAGEAYDYYCFDCDEEGIEPIPFMAWKKAFQDRQRKRAWEFPSNEPALNEDDMPF